MAPQTESTSSSSPSGGLACRVARQQVGVESSTNSRRFESGGYDDWSTVNDGGGRSSGSYPLHNEVAMEMESFEEQMMVAMAVSLSEARARTSSPKIEWH